VEFDDADIPDFVVEELKKNESPKKTKEMTPRQAQAADQNLNSELTALKTQVAELQMERSQILERLQRQIKDFENFKNRLDRERRETFVSQVCNLATLMLPVLDNLDRALTVVKELPGEKTAEFEHFYEGIELVNHQITDILERMGVQPVESIGEVFDPHLHEAVEMVVSDEMPPNSIVEEMLRGYRVGDRIIRHSMVKVVADPTVSGPVKKSPGDVSLSEDETVTDHRPQAEADEAGELISSAFPEPDDGPVDIELMEISNPEPTYE
jgi:molecular chaperone GrpE